MNAKEYKKIILIVTAPKLAETFRGEWINKNCPFTNPLHTAPPFIKDCVLEILGGEENISQQDTETDKEILALLKAHGQYKRDKAAWLNEASTGIFMEVDWRIQYAEAILENLEKTSAHG